MKYLLPILLMAVGKVHGQQDSLQAERFFVDSIGNQYMVLYKYLWDDNAMGRFPANCDIVKYKGNKQEIILRNFKAMYTLKETPADNTKLWLQRLYDYQSKRNNK